jgi:heme exporter protein A
LDEPFTAIDREGIRHLEERLADHVRRGGMLVITSHQSSLLEGCHVRRLGL